jgi:RNA polymerase-binding protein DksA
MLDQQHTLDFKTRLRERALHLRGEIQQVLARSSDESHTQVAERARDIEDDSFAALIVDTNLAEVDRDMDELRLIDAALQRLTAGTYGSCVDCGQPIPVARLEAEPTAARCVQCQALYEKTHASAATPSL